MLSEVCSYLNNYFCEPTDIHEGEFTIQDGLIEDIDFLQDGQYFRIVGSVMNDGVYQYNYDKLKDETFSGYIWAMFVPRDVINIALDIAAWNDAYSDVVMNPFQSESFGGYSYTKAGGGYYSSNQGVGWQTQFASRLKPYKKLRVM